jgi:hypothetical protein
MTKRVVVREVPQSEYPQWNSMVAGSPGGSIYSTPEYLDVFCGAAGGRFRLLAADRAGEIVGGIALYEHGTRWGLYLGARYLLYYNGFVVKPHPSKYPSERTAKAVDTLSALADGVARQPFGRVLIRSRCLPDVRMFKATGWQAQPSYSYVVSLEDLKATWERIEQNLRRLISRCEREGMKLSDDDDFDSYHRFHLLTASRKGTVAYLPEGAFKRYFQRLHALGLCRLYHARLPDGRAISSQIVLKDAHPVSHTVTAGADPEFMRTGATAFLRWKAFEHLASLGSQANDLTDAELNPVTHFKAQLGGDLVMNFVLTRPDRFGFALERSLKGARATVATLRERAASAVRQRSGPAS